MQGGFFFGIKIVAQRFIPLYKLKITKMKNLYIFLLVILSLFLQAQPYSSLLKGVDWTIIKIKMNGVEYLPPYPFVQGGKASFDFDNNNGFRSVFFNSATGKVTFGASNATYFTLQNIAVTLADYFGENEEQVQQFDYMTSSFYSRFQPTDQFNFVYEQIFSGKNLVVTNKFGNKIYYSNLILGNTDTALSKEISIYPNPIKTEFFIKSSNNVFEKGTAEIFDITGKMISKLNISSTNSVNIENCPDGNYVVKMIISGILYSSKLIIKK